MTPAVPLLFACAALFGLLGAVAATADSGSYRIEPKGNRVLGIAVSTLDPTWASASLVDEINLPQTAKEDLAQMQPSEYRFTLEGDFNRDGRPDKAVVGVYRTHAGEEGQFLLIVSRRGKGPWTVSYLSLNPGYPRPSVLESAPTWFNWFPCTACDVGASITWEGDHYDIGWADTESQTQ